jgi:Putative transposase DNA-binding domain
MLSRLDTGSMRILLREIGVSASMLIGRSAENGQTCPQCRHRYKPTGRRYRCPACGFVAHRDAVGAANILSVQATGEPGHVLPPAPTYRYPFWGKRSRPDTSDMAWVSTGRTGRAQEAAPLERPRSVTRQGCKRHRLGEIRVDGGKLRCYDSTWLMGCSDGLRPALQRPEAVQSSEGKDRAWRGVTPSHR